MIEEERKGQTIKDSSAISGFADYSESEQIHIHEWIELLRDVYTTSGFMPFQPRPVERTEDLAKKGGITGQMFVLARYQDSTLTELALPFDRTVPLALWINRHSQEVLFPYKRADISLSWRGEHAQKGRFRAFLQADIDVIGRELSCLADVDCLNALIRGLNALNLGSFTIYLNHMDISKALLQQLNPSEAQIPELLRIVDKIEKISTAEMVKELRSLLVTCTEQTALHFIESIRYKGALEHFPHKALADPKALSAKESLHEILRLLAAAGVDMSRVLFCPSMVRGLNYYTGVVFETYLDAFPKSGSIASGGRYNQLVESVSDHASVSVRGLEGVGASIGLTRIFDLLYHDAPSQGKKRTTSDALIIYRSDPEKNGLFQQMALILSQKLREKGHRIDLFASQNQKMKDMLSYANNKGYPKVVSIMDTASIVIRDMRTRNQEDLTSLEAVLERF